MFPTPNIPGSCSVLCKFNGQYEKGLSHPPDPDNWFHIRIAVHFPQIRVFVNGSPKPCPDIKPLDDRKSGRIGLWVGNGSDGGLRTIPEDFVPEIRPSSLAHNLLARSLMTAVEGEEVEGYFMVVGHKGFDALGGFQNIMVVGGGGDTAVAADLFVAFRRLVSP